jgi:rhomboid protease GluP
MTLPLANTIAGDPQAGASPRQPRRLRLPTVRPFWTYVVLAVNVVVFVAMEWAGGSTRRAVLIAFGANLARAVAAGQYWRLVTANFLHIGLFHLAINTYALYILGPEVESLFGHARFLLIYLLSGVTGALFSFMMTQGLSAGASTSLFGLFGALTVFFYRQRHILGPFGRQRLISLGVTLSINVIIGLSPGTQIDNWGHLGGLIGGVILAAFLCPRYQLVTTPVPSGAGEPVSWEAAVMDTNSLAEQRVSVGLFVIGLVALTIIARLVQS